MIGSYLIPNSTHLFTDHYATRIISVYSRIKNFINPEPLRFDVGDIPT
jgi:hypothetical protein